MIDGSVLQSAQRCFEKKSRVVVKMVVKRTYESTEKLASHINSWQVNANIFKVMRNAFFRDFYFSL